ncbi:MAG: MraY family glycosyltransferase [Desulfuromonadales bacterium]|nr:MraY family glycosyltransferase [Desulfuromonadales bacterium]MDW7756848.1 MraY family glycosyltransferase [Desulfuromonadales bacterium]
METILITCFYVGITAMFASLIMVPVLRRWALEKGQVDEPDQRKVHTVAIPRIGGIAIFMSFLFSHLVYVDIDPQVRGVLAGGVVIFFTGLIDDLHGLTPRRKFFGEIAGVAIAIAISDLYIHQLGDLFGFGNIVLPAWVGIPFTVFALVGVINAINLIDGLDGLAGGISAIALVVFSVLAYRDGNVSALLICSSMLGALLGFLKFNFYPARIFMGDAGSLTLGFVLAFMAVFITQGESSTTSPVVPALVLGLPILDTLWVMGRRLLLRQSPFSPDKTHLHHKFLSLGLDHRFTVLLIYGISLFWATVAMIFSHGHAGLLLACYLLTTLVRYGILRYILRHPDRFAFLKRDSSVSWRKSQIFLRIATVVDGLMPVMLITLVSYLGMVAVWGGGGAAHLWQITGILFLGMSILLYVTGDSNNYFFLASLYIVGLVTIFVADSSADQVVLWGMQVGEITWVAFILLGCMVFMKVIFRFEGEFFISTPDMLILGISIFFGFYSFHYSQHALVSPVFLKGTIFLLAIKAIGFKKKRRNRIAVYSCLAVLLVITLKGWLVPL